MRFNGGVWVAVVVATTTLQGSDWPQILGPNRDGVVPGETITNGWPADGPPVLWERPVGTGFAGIAVSDDIAILFHRVAGKERIEAMNTASGRVLWTSDAPATFQPSYTSDNGPRAVPLIHNNHVYTYGAMGTLRCVTLSDGKTVWSRETFDEYNSKRTRRGEPPEGYFGLGSTPIVADNKLLVNVGGDDANAGIVAFDLKTGKTVWKNTATRASYSSPTAVTLHGQPRVVFATRFEVLAIDPRNGQVAWQFPFGEPGPNVTAANPLIFDDRLFISASYGFGAVYAKVSPNSVEELWRRDDLLSSQYTTSVRLPTETGIHLIGIHGRQDIGRAALRCVDVSTEKVLWEQTDFGYATVLLIKNKLLALKTDGELVLAEVSSAGYRELATAQVLDSTTRALPALVDGKLFIRDTKTLKCLDLSGK
ncbi:outer membrane protein assembly factor BamB family protein [Thalassoroseus pseudoceratinae]|uniref:outer membrane protein assembly factor BamB family protein n=1 Tax=Thalassoroseus pseudoceratinae TaxID=2713176 RepID=UPI0014206A66|nr:PQQ-binding-like beta-propeller repeat protein [Thalassoroseus pseudoceratinae]